LSQVGFVPPTRASLYNPKSGLRPSDPDDEECPFQRKLQEIEAQYEKSLAAMLALELDVTGFETLKKCIDKIRARCASRKLELSQRLHSEYRTTYDDDLPEHVVQTWAEQIAASSRPTNTGTLFGICGPRRLNSPTVMRGLELHAANLALKAAGVASRKEANTAAVVREAVLVYRRKVGIIAQWPDERMWNSSDLRALLKFAVHVGVTADQLSVSALNKAALHDHWVKAWDNAKVGKELRAADLAAAEEERANAPAVAAAAAEAARVLAEKKVAEAAAAEEAREGAAGGEGAATLGAKDKGASGSGIAPAKTYGRKPSVKIGARVLSVAEAIAERAEEDGKRGGEALDKAEKAKRTARERKEKIMGCLSAMPEATWADIAKACTLAHWDALFKYAEDAGCALTSDEKKVKTLAGRRATFAGNSSLKRVIDQARQKVAELKTQAAAAAAPVGDGVLVLSEGPPQDIDAMLKRLAERRGEMTAEQTKFMKELI
jgi:hypothetical protein